MSFCWWDIIMINSFYLTFKFMTIIVWRATENYNIMLNQYGTRQKIIKMSNYVFTSEVPIIIFHFFCPFKSTRFYVQVIRNWVLNDLQLFTLSMMGRKKARKENTGEIPKCLFLLKLDYKALFYYNGLNNSCTFFCCTFWLHYVLFTWLMKPNFFEI